jgi:hypothetical protein
MALVRGSVDYNSEGNKNENQEIKGCPNHCAKSHVDIGPIQPHITKMPIIFYTNN